MNGWQRRSGNRAHAAFRHGATYAGHPDGLCRRGLANLDVLADEGLLKRAEALESTLHAVLRSLDDHPLVAEVRGGTGVLGALEFDPDRVAAEPGLSAAVARGARERGVLIRPMISTVGVLPAAHAHRRSPRPAR